MGWRRPTPKRCSDVAVWILRTTVRESERDDRLLDADDVDALIRAAGIVDRYGVAIAESAPRGHQAPLPGQLAADV